MEEEEMLTNRELDLEIQKAELAVLEAQRLHSRAEREAMRALTESLRLAVEGAGKVVYGTAKPEENELRRMQERLRVLRQERQNRAQDATFERLRLLERAGLALHLRVPLSPHVARVDRAEALEAAVKAGLLREERRSMYIGLGHYTIYHTTTLGRALSYRAERWAQGLEWRQSCEGL
jgi:hypothetical protein